MSDLIKIEINEKMEQTVSARSLHEFLEVGTPFRLWFPRMCEYGFAETVDYTPYFFVHPQNQQETIDYRMSIMMAKEISMLQRNEKGKRARQYFIQLENAWNSPEQVMARAIRIADKQIKTLTLQLEAQRPKVLFAEALEISDSSILIGELAKLLKQNGIDIGQNRLFEKLRSDGYLIKKRGESYNIPTQYSMELGLFEIKKGTINKPDGSVRLTTTPKVTGKGQIYFINKFKGTTKKEEKERELCLN